MELTHLSCTIGQLQLGASAHDDDIGGALAVLDDVGALLHTLTAGAGQVGHVLAGQGDGGGALAVLNTNLQVRRNSQ
eukprot:scaffold266328_cov18-Tisochrysis_lutea.AAC.1